MRAPCWPTSCRRSDTPHFGTGFAPCLTRGAPDVALPRSDFDRDGDQDLVVINDDVGGTIGLPNALWRNDGPAGGGWQLLQRLDWPVVTDPRFPTTRVALLAAEPLQGRRHQIRRHLKHIAHPILGDATHGKGPLNRAVAAHLGLQRLWLHAQQLVLSHPVTGEVLTLQAPLAAHWPVQAT